MNFKKLIFSPFHAYCIFCTIWCVGLLVLYMISHQKLFSLLELFFTADGHIANKGTAFLKALLAPVTLFILFLVPKLMQKRNLKVNYLFAYITFFAVHFMIYIFHNRFVEKQIEGNALENLTVILSLFASTLFLFSAFRGNLLSYLLSVFWLIFALEEASWGQRYFDFSTPNFFLEKNYQKEVNLHNFLNPYFGSIYVIFNFLIFSTLTLFSELSVLKKMYNLPSISFVIKLSDKYSIWIIPLILIGASFAPGHEFVEQQWSLFGLLLASLLILERRTHP